MITDAAVTTQQDLHLQFNCIKC